MNDPHTVLGVAKNASDEQIREAFRSLAKQHHPDKNPGDVAAEARFKEISSAYDILKDPQKRAALNRKPFSRQAPGGSTEWNFAAGVDINDLMHAFAARHRAQNSDLQIRCSISLEDAFNGRELDLTLRTAQGGSRDITISIPRGVDAGSRLRVAGKGDSTYPNLPQGDLYVEIDVFPHAIFKRVSKNLLMMVEVNVFDAILGCTVQVETIDKKTIDVQVPHNTQIGQRLRVQGHGMTVHGGGPRGDLIIEVFVRMLSQLSQEQRDLIQQAKQLGDLTTAD